MIKKEFDSKSKNANTIELRNKLFKDIEGELIFDYKIKKIVLEEGSVEYIESLEDKAKNITDGANITSKIGILNSTMINSFISNVIIQLKKIEKK